MRVKQSLGAGKIFAMDGLGSGPSRGWGAPLMDRWADHHRRRVRTFELKDGGKRTALEVEADDVSVSLRFATCKVAKVSRSRPAESTAASGLPAEADPWAADAPGGYSDEAFVRGGCLDAEGSPAPGADLASMGG